MRNRNSVLNLIQEDSKCAEIGVWKGEFSQEILKRNPKNST